MEENDLFENQVFDNKRSEPLTFQQMVLDPGNLVFLLDQLKYYANMGRKFTPKYDILYKDHMELIEKWNMLIDITLEKTSLSIEELNNLLKTEKEKGDDGWRKYVNKDAFESFIRLYPEKLERSFSMNCMSWYDFSKGRDKGKLVAMLDCNYGSEETRYMIAADVLEELEVHNEI